MDHVEDPADKQGYQDLDAYEPEKQWIIVVEYQRFNPDQGNNCDDGQDDTSPIKRGQARPYGESQRVVARF